MPIPALRTTPCRRGAFTLLEMAVVLAIIGLMAGAVLVATSYLKSAKQTALVNEVKFYLNAMKQFETMYGGAIAGDMGNATSYWGDRATGTAACPDAAIANGSPGTCNGAGDGRVYFNTSNAAEIFLVYQHLRLAGLIQGNYTGYAGTAGGFDVEVGVNTPVLPMDNVTAYFSAASATGYASGDTYLYDGNYGAYLMMTGAAITDNLPLNGYLTPTEAYELDGKFDNGIPNTGWMRSFNNTLRPNCAGATSYNLSSGSPNDACNLVFTQP